MKPTIKCFMYHYKSAHDGNSTNLEVKAKFSAMNFWKVFVKTNIPLKVIMKRGCVWGPYLYKYVLYSGRHWWHKTLLNQFF